jgi:hypothetical protein
MSLVATQAINKTQTLINSGIITLASIAWSDVIQSIIAYINPMEKDSLKTKLIYAVIITVFVIIYTTYSDKIFKKKEDN